MIIKWEGKFIGFSSALTGVDTATSIKEVIVIKGIKPWKATFPLKWINSKGFIKLPPCQRHYTKLGKINFKLALAPF